MDDASAPRPVAALSFADIVAGAGGRHPTDVLAALNVGAGADARRLASEAARPPPASVLAQGDGLALPHPLDAEWRFDDATADALLARAVDLTQAGEAVLLLGVPTVVLAAARSGAARRFVVACEDNVIGAALAARVAADARFVRAAPEGCAAAIVDPPWYPAVFDALLTQAGAACRAGGWVLVGAPSAGVRPTAADERVASLATAVVAGLSLVADEPDALTYRTPAFELAAMRTSGVSAWLPSWRRGDLLSFRKTGPGEAQPLPPARPAFELTLEGVRFRLIAGPAVPATPLTPLVPDEVFPSVSARAAGRDRANLWTSGNRAFVCDPGSTLQAMLALAARNDLWPKGLDPAGIESRDSPSIDPIQRVDELARIAARDLAHAAMLVGVSSWDRSVNDARFLNGSSTAFRRTLRGGPG
ncbi:MAG: hypothetical protein A2790_10635 [Phenylobacterium sp. RIFCSPHIGHO2_01_FULL_69_31]|uniref:hypothetical protein n=1 Tax=Phenylobacterium sp. RIFCSPHIGHO2_01_FULL_69_31 TaxID=1801944 RepID=UPI0008B8391C|nr:hypothetical protein [Phenylobacterium sp. RIFCSPHIGHO2_01_FULL_69_31]OHB31100.1 MAG: hypothetical protein A2790_10635 [Phenylobacterium sp. RIFCSPHIGHO2_01_FULL_69_31]